jgi:hypothetical protein
VRLCAVDQNSDRGVNRVAVDVMHVAALLPTLETFRRRRLASSFILQSECAGLALIAPRCITHGLARRVRSACARSVERSFVPCSLFSMF